MERSLRKRECEGCFARFWLDSLVRMQLMNRAHTVTLFDMVLCDSCRDHYVQWWWNADPTVYRYYHPA
jgi:hypothetical protein